MTWRGSRNESEGSRNESEMGITRVLKCWHNFLTLQVVMKNVIVKIFAVLLSVWYSMSVIGFDVHTCSGSGRSCIVTFIEGLTCEDIHPEHSCDKASCCADRLDCCSSHEEGQGHQHCGGMTGFADHEDDHSDCPFCDGISLKSKSCCSNDYQVLVLTGTTIVNDHNHFDECACGHCLCIDLQSGEIPAALAENNLTAYIHEPDSGFLKACERQAVLRIWRV